MSGIINILLNFSLHIGYPGIVLLMTIESSFIPFPSEVVIPPAAYLAQQGQFNLTFVVLAGILGSLLGATINYVLAITLGRRIIYALASTRCAKIFMINANKVQKAEKYFLKYGNASTFLGRLVPAIRQLISIPAGFSRMNFRNFLLFTFLGSGIWTAILAVLGYAFGANQELLQRYYKEISAFFLSLAGIFVIYVLYRVIKERGGASHRPGTAPKKPDISK